MKRLIVTLFLILLGVSSPNGQSCTEYKRSDYQHWIDADGDCQSTRNEVLIAESLVPVTFKTLKGCRVVSGKWVDPFTGRVFTDPKRLDIDHVVLLKGANDSGV